MVILAIIGILCILISSAINAANKTTQNPPPIITSNREITIDGNYMDVQVKLSVVELDGCEYIVLSKYHGGAIIHKQNCKFCAKQPHPVMTPEAIEKYVPNGGIKKWKNYY